MAFQFTRCEFIGGPLDGTVRDHCIEPIDGTQYTQESHSYELSGKRWLYRGRWRHAEHKGVMFAFRTFQELMLQTAQMQTSVEGWTVYDSLTLQSKVKYEMGDDYWKGYKHGITQHKI